LPFSALAADLKSANISLVSAATDPVSYASTDICGDLSGPATASVPSFLQPNATAIAPAGDTPTQPTAPPLSAALVFQSGFIDPSDATG
jgi:hypothetical protein